MNRKRCKTCKKLKALECFYAHPYTRDLKNIYCKECERRRDKARWAIVKATPSMLLIHRERSRFAKRSTPKVDSERRAIITARWNAKHPDRKKAHRILRRAIIKGQLVKPSTCSKCGSSGRIEGHHKDYKFPLEVEWLCVRCHGKTRWKKFEPVNPQQPI